MGRAGAGGLETTRRATPGRAGGLSGLLLAVLGGVAACGHERAVAARTGWLALTTEQRAAALFERCGTAPRYLRVPGALLRFQELGPGVGPLESAAAHGDGHVAAGDGPARSCAADAGEGRAYLAADTDPPWLLVHGLGGSMGDFAPLLLTAARRHRVIAVDLPGFGGSVSLASDYTVAAFGRALRSFLAALRLERVHLVCHSLGGQVCLGLALDSPARVASLTLIDSSGSYDPAWFVRHATRGALGTLFPDKDPVVQEVLGGDVAVLGRLLSSDPFLVAAVSSFQDSYRGRLRDVSVPTLVVWGEKDVLFPVDEGVFLKENVPGSTLRVVHGAGHAPQLSRPALVTRWIERFHDGLDPRSIP